MGRKPDEFTSECVWCVCTSVCACVCALAQQPEQEASHAMLDLCFYFVSHRDQMKDFDQIFILHSHSVGSLESGLEGS